MNRIDRTKGPSARALTAAGVLLALLALPMTTYGMWRLLLQPRPLGAIDLRLRWVEVHAWFDGQPVYSTISDAMYPPASYVLLWPFVGWLRFQGARWLWGAVCVAALALLVALVLRASGVEQRKQRRVLALVPFATYPVGATLGNGQLGLVVTAALFALALLLSERERSWPRDLALAACMLCALVKPTMSAAFFWVLLLAPGGLRAALLTVSAYVALTSFASLWQATGPIASFQAWLDRGVVGAVYGAQKGGGAIQVTPSGRLWIRGINVHSVLSACKRVDLALEASLVLLALQGVWTFFHRRAPLWTLLAVAAWVANFSSYHGWYDHVVLLVPLVALFRRARQGERAAAVLSVALLLSLLAPGGVYALPYPWNNVYVLTQAAVWIAAFGYLLVRPGPGRGVAAAAVPSPYEGADAAPRSRAQ